MKLPSLDSNKPILTSSGLMMDFFSYFLRLVYYKLRNCDDDSLSLADDAEITLDTGPGYGWCQIGDNQEYAYFTFTSAGVVTLVSNSANAVNTDTDAKLCIYDGGTKVKIKNRLGSTLSLRYTVKYNPI